MIRHGIDILKQYGIVTNVFFAPSHTFDKNTLIALKEESNIRIISDTIANDVYFENDFYFIPEQSGRVRNLPFKLCTFCYHPNTMSDKDFENLEIFLKKYYFKFVAVKEIELNKRLKSLFDKLLHFMYFVKR